MGDHKFIISSSFVLRKHVKLLVPAAFALAPTNPHWARVVGYGPFSIKKVCVPVLGLMMMMMRIFLINTYIHTTHALSPKG
jgi:hypothetical protein